MITTVLAILLQAQVILSGQGRVDVVAGAAFTAETAVFDGANDYLTLSAEPTGGSTATTFTVSVWLDFGGGDAAQQTIFWNNADRLVIEKTTGNAIHVVGRTTGGTVVLDATTSITKVAADGWFHLYVAISMASTATRKIYFDGAEDVGVTWTTYNTGAGTIDQMQNPTRIGGAGSGLIKLNAAVAEFWYNDTYLDDTTLFESGGSPISLGTTGEIPLGSAPVMYLSRNGSGNSWATDSSGNGNTFTVTGTLGSTTPP